MSAPGRAALVLSGGGARGAYEAGVLSYLFEEIYPALPEGFEFDIVSGTSVGAIHAAYLAATAHMRGPARAREIVDTWLEMQLSDVLRLSATDLLSLPLRALGLSRLVRGGDGGRPDSVGGLVDLSPLERIVEQRIPWKHLASNLATSRPGALCISCTQVRTGRITVFMEGPLSETSAWEFDPNAVAVTANLGPHHVRASAAIPFLFPAVRIGDRYYVDGGVRHNTPLSPVIRLCADRVLVVALKHQPGRGEELPAYPEEVITQPAFLLGKVLNALLLDQIEYELERIELVNAWIERGCSAFGEQFLDTINVAVRERRGVGYRRMRSAVIRPSEDLGRLAACCQREGRLQMRGLPRMLARLTLRGVPENEADLLSYLLFDRCFTGRLVELGRRDTAAQREEIVALLTG